VNKKYEKQVLSCFELQGKDKDGHRPVWKQMRKGGQRHLGEERHRVYKKTVAWTRVPVQESWLC